jgi:hypothetical protein
MEEFYAAHTNYQPTFLRRHQSTTQRQSSVQTQNKQESQMQTHTTACTYVLWKNVWAAEQEIMTVYSENHIKYIYTVCRQS